MLHIAIAGDRFVTVDLVQELLRQSLEPAAGSFTTSGLELGWPDDTPIKDAELQEFVGDPQAIARFVGDAQVVLTQVAPISRALIENAPNLEIIGCFRGGPVNVNLTAATERGIPVLFSPGGNAAPSPSSPSASSWPNAKASPAPTAPWLRANGGPPSTTMPSALASFTARPSA